MQHESGSLNRFSQVHNKATTKGGSDMEVWKDIQGYEGLYQVSNLGNVRSLNWRNTGQVRNLYLKPQNRGYLQVELAKCGQKRGFTVHRLVAMAFVSGYAEGKVVNHINEDKRDNRAENLEWVSQSDNTLLFLNGVVRTQLPLFRSQRTGHAPFGIAYWRWSRQQALMLGV